MPANDDESGHSTTTTYSPFYLIKFTIHAGHKTNRTASINQITSTVWTVNDVHCALWMGSSCEYIFQSVSFEIVNQLDYIFIVMKHRKWLFMSIFWILIHIFFCCRFFFLWFPIDFNQIMKSIVVREREL